LRGSYDIYLESPNWFLPSASDRANLGEQNPCLSFWQISFIHSNS